MIDHNQFTDFMLDQFDIEMVTEASVENWIEAVEDAEKSLVSSVLNRIFMSMLTASCGAGWLKSGMKLGDFVDRSVVNNGVSEETIKENRDINEILSRYGDVYLKERDVPVILLRDKETGKIIDSSFDKDFMNTQFLFSAFMDEILGGGL